MSLYVRLKWNTIWLKCWLLLHTNFFNSLVASSSNARSYSHRSRLPHKRSALFLPPLGHLQSPPRRSQTCPASHGSTPPLPQTLFQRLPIYIRFYTNSRKHSSVGRRIKTFSPYLYTCRIRIITLHFYVRILTRFRGRILTRAHNLDWHLWVHLTPAIKSCTRYLNKYTTQTLLQRFLHTTVL